MNKIVDNKYSKYTKIEGTMSLILNLVLFALKYWAGMVSGSVAMIADAWHTLSDSVTSLVVLIGAKITEKPADKDHPFGHGRAELISTIIIGVLLAIVGVVFIHDSITKLKEHQPASFGIIAIVVTSISVVTKEIMARLAIHYGKKVNSTSMIADGWHHRTDALSSLLILIGIIFAKYYWWIDGALGIGVGIFIFITAYKILKDTISPILGESPDDELIENLDKLSVKVSDNMLHIHHIHVHKYGNHTELTFHIKLQGDMNLVEANKITSKFVSLIWQELNMAATIYIDAYVENVEYRVLRFSYEDKTHFSQATEIRNTVFIKEHKVDKALELDGLDIDCQHYLILDNEKPIATTRWRNTDKGIKIERFAVIKEYREKGVGKFMLNTMLSDLHSLNTTIYLYAQDNAVDFYKKYNFKVVGDKFVEANIVHYEMYYDI